MAAPDPSTRAEHQAVPVSAAALSALVIDRNSSEGARTIDITTTGARTGEPRRIEMWFYRVDDECYLTTQPGRRSWYANLRAHPRFTVHVKHRVRADLPATAHPVTDPADRRRVLAAVIDDLQAVLDRQRSSQRLPPLERWVESSPLIRFTIDAPKQPSLTRSPEPARPI